MVMNFRFFTEAGSSSKLPTFRLGYCQQGWSLGTSQRHTLDKSSENGASWHDCRKLSPCHRLFLRRRRSIRTETSSYSHHWRRHGQPLDTAPALKDKPWADPSCLLARESGPMDEASVDGQGYVGLVWPA